MAAATAESAERSAGIGDAVIRREDLPLITGEAQYTDDITESRMAHAALLRSQYAHARVVEVDASEAEALDGVLAVFTAADVAAADVPGNVPSLSAPPQGGMARLIEGVNEPRRPILAEDVVRYTGEAIAVVVAEDRYTAHEARDLIAVEYERLDATTDPVESAGDDAPRLHDDIPGNLALDWEIGDRAATDEAFAEADHVIERDLPIQRLAPNAMEPRGAIARYRRHTGELDVTMGTQVPHQHKGVIAESLGIPDHKVHLRAPHVGGGFGLKSKFYQGEFVTAFCAMQLGRPVKWQATRSESFTSDLNGRGHEAHAGIAFDDDGTIRGFRVHSHVDLGAYLSKVTPYLSTGAIGAVLSNQYAIPAIHGRFTGVFTNKAPLDAYRGAGRPEAAYLTDRLVALAARELGMDPVEFRRRNFIPADQFPYTTAVGTEYDSGDYEGTLEKALDLLGYDDLRAKQERLREEGRYLGIGLGCFVETAGDPRKESSLVRFHPSGTITAYMGSSDQGQAHQTTFAQILADELGVPYNDIEVREGDSDAPEGTGTFGSRTAVVGGTALVRSAEKLIEQARRTAAHRLEASEGDVEFDDGEFHVRGAPERAIHIQEVARQAYAGNVPDGTEPALEATAFGQADTTIPFGCHIAVVEVDPDSGEIDFQRYVAVDDCGVQINPMVVEGQVVGGVAQGVGHALYEEVVYDDNGTLVTGTLQDYAMPRAESMPRIETGHTVTPSPRNPLGVKGVAESGTCPPPAAIVNAVTDALAPLGVEHVDTPATPERVWRAIQNAERGS